MDVTNLLRELRIVANIEIVITFLPEMLGGCPTQAFFWLEWGSSDQSPRNALLERFHGIGERAALRLADEQVNMFGHDNVGVNVDPEAPPHSFERELEDSLGMVVTQQRLPVIAGESHEVTVSGLLQPFQSPRY